jgi:polyphenol oxidase
MWHTAPSFAAHQIVHGFSDRHGGVSQPPFDSLNFDDRQDDPQHVLHNQKLALAELGYSLEQTCTLEQIHSVQVCEAKVGQQVGDALVSSQVGVLLAIATADCFPIVFADPVAGVIGAAHAGWRGTLGDSLGSDIAGATVRAMLERGAALERILVAIGPGIAAHEYPVPPLRAQEFLDAGFPERVVPTVQGQPCLDLLEANRFNLTRAGILPHNVWAMPRSSSESDFFSYRRDHGLTGRMWAVIGL